MITWVFSASHYMYIHLLHHHLAEGRCWEPSSFRFIIEWQISSISCHMTWCCEVRWLETKAHSLFPSLFYLFWSQGNMGPPMAPGRSVIDIQQFSIGTSHSCTNTRSSFSKSFQLVPLGQTFPQNLNSTMLEKITHQTCTVNKLPTGKRNGTAPHQYRHLSNTPLSGDSLNHRFWPFRVEVEYLLPSTFANSLMWTLWQQKQTPLIICDETSCPTLR